MLRRLLACSSNIGSTVALLLVVFGLLVSESAVWTWLSSFNFRLFFSGCVDEEDPNSDSSLSLASFPFMEVLLLSSLFNFCRFFSGWGDEELPNKEPSLSLSLFAVILAQTYSWIDQGALFFTMTMVAHCTQERKKEKAIQNFPL